EWSAPHPFDALCEVAEERNASLIVVAARERGSVGGLFLGSTPDRLIHEPPFPSTCYRTATRPSTSSPPVRPRTHCGRVRRQPRRRRIREPVAAAVGTSIASWPINSDNWITSRSFRWGRVPWRSQ
ncbi:MAG: universal stress protein, partial [Acidimicrobiales bacterium]